MQPYCIARVAVEGAAFAYDKEYSYLVPDGWTVLAGQRVRVPFGRANKKKLAIVLEASGAQSRDRLKPILEVVDPAPMLDAEGLRLLRYLKEHTFCTYYEALRLLLPAGLGVVYRTLYTAGNRPPSRFLTNEEQAVAEYLRSYRRPVESGRLQKRFGVTGAVLEDLVSEGVLNHAEDRTQMVRDEKITMVRLREEWQEEPLTKKQQAVVDFLLENETASLKEVCYYAAATRAVTDALERREAVEYYSQPVLRSPFSTAVQAVAEEPPPLSVEQQAAYEALEGMLMEEKPAPALLYGVTGSGKTEVYLRLIRRVLELGKTALVMVPEIALTAQAVEGFHRRFGERVAVLHSALSLGERMDQWKRVKSGDAPIVVGTRSAVFAPLSNIGLIVMDEEQEHTYKSDKTPRFHARDVARLRSGQHGALLLLASATPSVESYHAAKQGHYRLVELEERFGDALLPDVFVVDMKDTQNATAQPWLSLPLLGELQMTLERGEQSILLLNRRGYSTLIKCSSCGVVADCPHCSVALTYHQANNRLMCHYCGYLQERITVCSHCGSELVRYAGTGTQKLEEELASLLPKARVLRVDMDTTMAKFSHEKHFSAFLRKEYDIMIGTQMVAKGLNFPGVTLVGVLQADQSLYGGDFRSFERSFSLLTQVVGRGGRGDLRARAIIQTYSPENPVIRLAAMQDYPGFFADEIVSRRLHLYPPYCVMAGIGFVGEDEKLVQQGCKAFLERFRAQAAERYASLPVRLLGPVASDIPKAAGKYRYKLVLKCRNTAAMRTLLQEVLLWFLGENKAVHAFIDMHCDRL